MASTLTNLRVFFFALLLPAFPLLQVAKCQLDSDVDVSESADEATDLGIVGEDAQNFGDASFSLAPGVETAVVFHKTAPGVEEINVIAIKASVHLHFDHRMLVQNLTAQAFNNATIPGHAQSTFPYYFAVSKYLQPGTFDLVGTIIYEIDQHPYQSVFYNGTNRMAQSNEFIDLMCTIEVVESGGFLSMESVFLFTLGIALLVLLVLWIHGQIQSLSKRDSKLDLDEIYTITKYWKTVQKRIRKQN
ncbi:hypothetical protein K2173_013608 [Erythroxylum novogranatense]|uniref:Signal sequence receptor subunit alpha n=1 Tax=Erythroxylum novogranatense TaxID=1862640 RepID=A0AAV8TK03_9ROSI|nr:hypothetical protein K2173_013608 [Erythroxylum novogranatense]